MILLIITQNQKYLNKYVIWINNYFITRISLTPKTDAVLMDETPINYILIDDPLYSINWRGVKPPTSHNSVYRTRLEN